MVGCGGSGNDTQQAATHSSANAPSIQTAPKPKPKPAPKPQPVNTEDQACSGYSGPDANACQDSYEYLCVDGQVKQKVQAYYQGNSSDLSTVAQQWARSYYTSQGSWQAGMAGCLAALNDEYHRLCGGG